jgi:hypothetical protein
MRFSSDSTLAYNPSAQSVWLTVGGAPVEVRGGETARLSLE